MPIEIARLDIQNAVAIGVISENGNAPNERHTWFRDGGARKWSLYCDTSRVRWRCEYVVCILRYTHENEREGSVLMTRSVVLH